MAGKNGRINWIKTPGERGLYMREYDGGRVYMLQSQIGGKRMSETLGRVSLEEARIIREKLALNRKAGSGPQTYAEMLEAEKRELAARKIEEERAIRETLEMERKRRLHTVGKVWEEAFWPHRLTLKRAAKSVTCVEGRWEHYVRQAFGHIPLADLGKRHFLDFMAAMEKKGIGANTIGKCMVDMRQLWNFAIEEQIVATSFPGKMALRELQRGYDSEKKCWLNPGEARLLVDTVYKRRLKSRIDHDVYCYVILGLALGLRAGDIHKLTIQEVERHIIDKTKNGRARFVHFNYAPVQTMLEERCQLYPPATADEPLFRSFGATASRGIRGEVPRKFYRTIQELGFNEAPRRKGRHLEKIDFHALRHTFATMAAMAGVDHFTLMRLMGHKTPAMTLRYIEIAEAHQAKHQEKAMAAIFPPELKRDDPEQLEE